MAVSAFQSVCQHRSTERCADCAWDACEFGEVCIDFDGGGVKPKGCSGNTNEDTDFTCTEGVIKIDPIEGNDEAACCNVMCSGNADDSFDYSCPTGKHLKAGHADIIGNDETACCDTTPITGMCSGNTDSTTDYTCTEGVLKTNSNTITGNTEGACCDVMCSGNADSAADHTCTIGVLKTNPNTIIGDDEDTCCDVMCSETRTVPQTIIARKAR